MRACLNYYTAFEAYWTADNKGDFITRNPSIGALAMEIEELRMELVKAEEEANGR